MKVQATVSECFASLITEATLIIFSFVEKNICLYMTGEQGSSVEALQFERPRVGQ